MTQKQQLTDLDLSSALQ